MKWKIFLLEQSVSFGLVRSSWFSFAQVVYPPFIAKTSICWPFPSSIFLFTFCPYSKNHDLDWINFCHYYQSGGQASWFCICFKWFSQYHQVLTILCKDPWTISPIFFFYVYFVLICNVVRLIFGLGDVFVWLSPSNPSPVMLRVF